MQLVTPSKLAMDWIEAISPKATKKKFEGSQTNTIERTCMVCKTVLGVGEKSFPAVFKGTFVDRAYVQPNKSSSCMCPECFEVLDSPPCAVQLTYCTIGKGENGKPVAYAVLKDSDFAAAMINPPKAPFIFAMKTAKKQHMLWKCDVNIEDASETGVVLFSLGDKRLYAKPQVLLALLKKEEELKGLVQKHLEDRGIKKPMPYSFFSAQTRDNNEFSDYQPRNLSNLELPEDLASRIIKFQTVVCKLSEGDRYTFSVFFRDRRKNMDMEFDDWVKSKIPTPVDPEVITKYYNK